MSKNTAIPVDNFATDKEVQLVALIAEDLRPVEIAAKMKAKRSLVESQIFYLRRKFAKKTNAGLVILFVRNGLIE